MFKCPLCPPQLPAYYAPSAHYTHPTQPDYFAYSAHFVFDKIWKTYLLSFKHVNDVAPVIKVNSILFDHAFQQS